MIEICSFEELDALVAENVMLLPEEYGLKKCGYWYRKDACGYTDNILEAWRVSSEEAKKHEYPHDEPVTMVKLAPLKYSQDIAQAWRVVEILKTRGMWPRIETEGGYKDEWGCQIFVGEGDDATPLEKTAKTAPLAICLCALASVGIEVKFNPKDLI